MTEMLSTREAAKVLNTGYPHETLAILKAAGVDSKRIGGERGAYIWDGEQVKTLRNLLDRDIKGREATQ